MSYRHSIEAMFQDLSKVPITDYPKLRDTLTIVNMPKNSKSLGNNLLKEIFSINESRLLVITGHLYFDYILEKMLDQEPNNFTVRQRESFHAKLEFLASRGKFDANTYQCLQAINRLRNMFAHNIFFDIVDWDPKLVPYTEQFNLKIPKRKHFLRAFNIVLLRMTFFAVYFILVDQNTWLYLEDVPKR